MKIFHPTVHRLHAPAWYLADGCTRPCPETPARVDNILESLRSANTHELIPISPIKNQKSKIKNPLTLALEKIHTQPYLHYLQTIHSLWHKEFQTDVLPDTFPRFRTSLPHSGLRTQDSVLPSKPATQAGYYCFDLAAPITAGTWAAALNSAQTALAAANAILPSPPSPSDHWPLTTDHSAYALCRPPGHHAGPDYCGGFCYLNNAALAAQHLLNAGQKKIAILDLDYHHGNGTQDIFYHRANVLFISLHADPNTQYPYFWGHANETGEAAGKDFTLNLPLPRNASPKKWFNALHTALARIEKFRPDSLLISLGTDTHEKDPVGDFKLTTQHFATCARLLRSLNLPTLFLQEGGYNLQTLGPLITTTLNAFS